MSQDQKSVERKKPQEEFFNKISSEVNQEVGLPVCWLKGKVILDNFRVKYNRKKDGDISYYVSLFAHSWDFVTKCLSKNFILTNYGYLIPEEKIDLFDFWSESNFSSECLPVSRLLFRTGDIVINSKENPVTQNGKLRDLFSFCMGYHDFLEEAREKKYIKAPLSLSNPASAKALGVSSAYLVDYNGQHRKTDVEIKDGSFFLWTNALICVLICL